ncbi:MAG: hypothetical protein LBH24_02730 [Clostridiales bacterium]|jgi:hypothetical protein|nr:hypothetical protein [Clostridiales bacterium]
MKGLKRILILVLAALLCAAMLTACIGGDGGGSGGKTNENPWEIIVADLQNATSGRAIWIKDRQEKFAASHPEWTITHQPNPSADVSQVVQSVVQNLQSGTNAYTVLPVTAAHYARTIYQTGLIADLQDYIAADDLAAIDPGVLKSYQKKDAIVGYPWGRDFPMIAFNKKVLAQKVRDAVITQADVEALRTGAAMPWGDNGEMLTIRTWDGFRAFLKQLSKSGVPGFAGVANDYYLLVGMFNIANQFRAAVQNDDGTITVDFTNDATVRTFEFLQNLQEDGSYKQSTQTAMYTTWDNFILGNFASMVFYPGWISYFEEKSMYANDFLLVNMPAGPDTLAAGADAVPANPTFSSGFVVREKASDAKKALAMEYLDYVYGKDALLEMMDFCVENDIAEVFLPAHTLTAAEFDRAMAFAPADWINPYRTAMTDSYVFDLDADGFVSYIRPYLSAIIEKDSAYKGWDAIKARLQTVNNIVYTEYLNGYNARVLAD